MQYVDIKPYRLDGIDIGIEPMNKKGGTDENCYSGCQYRRP